MVRTVPAIHSNLFPLIHITSLQAHSPHSYHRYPTESILPCKPFSYSLHFEIMESENGSSAAATSATEEKIKGLSATDNIDGTGMRVAVIYTRWNEKVVGALKDGCKDQLIKRGVAEEDILFHQVSCVHLALPCHAISYHVIHVSHLKDL